MFMYSSLCFIHRICIRFFGLSFRFWSFCFFSLSLNLMTMVTCVSCNHFKNQINPDQRKWFFGSFRTQRNRFKANEPIKYALKGKNQPKVKITFGSLRCGPFDMFTAN